MRACSPRRASSRSPPIRIVTTQAAANVRDNFDTGSFANNDGTHRWYGDWIEQDDDNSPHGGKVTIGWQDRGGGRLILRQQRRHLSPRRHAVELARRSRSSSSTLRAGLEAGEYVSVQASGNGGTQLDRARPHLRRRPTTTRFVNQSYNITAYRGRNTAIRFVGSMNEPLRRRLRRHRRRRDHLHHHLRRRRPGPRRRERARPAHRRHQGPRRRRRRHRHRLLEARLARQGFRRQRPRGGAVRRRSTTWSRPPGRPVSTDTTGHGTHVTSLIASSRKDGSGRYFGVAPDARIISIKAFGEDGSSTYATVIRAIDWVITNRTQYAIRVLNLSLGAPARSRYWDDPLNKAVMRAWQSGIVVVVSAGNSGPLPQTVGVPGNVPYVITVGAMTDNYTNNKNDDRLASFSAAGPDIRRLREARPRRARRPRLGLHGHVSEDRGGPSHLHEQRRLLHHVRHVAVGGRGLGRRGAGAGRRTRASRPTR